MKYLKVLLFGILFFLIALESSMLDAATIYTYVHNSNGNYVSNAKVILYDNDWNYIDNDSTDGSGKADFNDLSYGTYNYEVYYSGGGVEEFWGSDEDFYLGSSTITRHFYRDWPYLYSPDITPTSLNVGEQVEIKIIVLNKLSYSRSVKVELWADRDKSSSWDFNEMSSAKTVSAGGTSTFTFNITPSSSGTYYWKSNIRSYNNASSIYIITDSSPWTTAFSTVSQDMIITSFTPPLGEHHRGEELQVFVNVKNNGNSAKSYWVGLSFAHSTTTGDNWPVGWYDIKPLQTSVLGPNQEEMITFLFTIPETWRSGQYYAVSRIWGNFNESLYIMEDPIESTLWHPFSHPEWVDNADIGMQTLSLPNISIPDGAKSLIDQFSMISMLVENKGIQELYFEGKKLLVCLRASQSISIIPGVTVSVGGAVFIDLADLCELTPEGREGWTTMWFASEIGALTYDNSSNPFEFGIITHNFNFNERGIGDYKSDVLSFGQLTVPGISITLAKYDSDDGFQGPSWDFSGTKKVAVSVESGENIIQKIEIGTPYVLAALLGASASLNRDVPISEYVGWVSNILDSYENNSNVYRDFTYDDGDWTVQNGQLITNLSMRNIDHIYWYNLAHRFMIKVPSNVSTLDISTNGGTGDLRIYLKKDARPLPNETFYDVSSSWNQGSTNESININNPAPGNYYIELPIYGNPPLGYEGVTFVASFETSQQTPVMQIIGDGLLIVSGDTTTNTLDNTNFGIRDVNNGGVENEFEIKNIGNSTLHLNGVPIIYIDGPHSQDYTVTTHPNAEIEQSQSTLFRVSFNPSADGIRYANINVSSDDQLNNPYFFKISGTGITSTDTTSTPIISVSQESMYFSATQDRSRPDDQTVTITNSGEGVLNWQISEDISWLSVSPTSGNSNNDVINVSVLTTSLPEGEYSGIITVTSNNANNSPQNIIVDYIVTFSNLVAYYPFNSNANDESGNGNDGTVHGATLTTDRFGNANSAYSFDGVDDYIQILNNNVFDIQDEITISFWIKLETPAPYYFPYHTIQKSGSWGGGQGNSSGFDIHFGLNGVNSPNIYSVWHTGFSPEIFYQFVLTYDGSIAKWYEDGVLKDSVVISDKIPITTSDIWIGQHEQDLRYNFDGVIDDIRIYNRALTESEIDSLYHLGGWVTQTPGDTLFFDDFSGDLSQWTDYNGGGSYNIQIVGSDGNPAPSLLTDDNTSWGCSVISNEFFDYSNGLILSADHLNAAPTSQRYSFMALTTDPVGDYTNIVMASLNYGNTALHCALRYDSSGTEYDESFLAPVPTVEDWQNCRFKIRPDHYVEFFYNDSLVYTSNHQITQQYDGQVKVRIGHRKSYYDNVLVMSIQESQNMYTVSLGNTEVSHPDTSSVPVTISGDPGVNINSFELTLDRGSGDLLFMEIDTSNTLIGSAGWMYALNETDSTILFAAAGSNEITMDGTLLYLRYAPMGDPCNTIPITIDTCVVNTGSDSLTLENGSVTILPEPVYGDVDENGDVQAYDAAVLLEHLVYEDTLVCQGLANAEVSLNDTITAFDASLILRAVVGEIGLPYSEPVLATGNIIVEDVSINAGQEFDFPINISNGENIYSYQGVIKYDQEQITLTNIWKFRKFRTVIPVIFRTLILAS